MPARNPPSRKNQTPKEELKQRLEKLAVKDREALAVFAGRCALRVMPWLATDKGLAYWGDNQVKHLLAVEAASISALLYNLNAAAYAAYAAAAAAANANAYAAAAAYAATDAAYAANAANAANAAYADANTVAYAAIKNDLNLLEKGQTQTVREHPLWPNHSPPKSFPKRLKQFEEALQNLNQHDLLNRYQAVLKGGTDPAAIYKGVLESWLETKDTDPDNTAKTTPPQYIATTRTAAEKPGQQDHLNRTHLAQALSRFLLDKDNIEHQTIGLLGDWGVGKTTFINLLKKALSADKQGVKFLCGDYNAWEFEHTSNQQAGMAQKAIKGLTDDLNWWRKRCLAFRLSRKNKPVLTVLIPMVLIALALLFSDLTPVPNMLRWAVEAYLPESVFTSLYKAHPILINALPVFLALSLLSWQFLFRMPDLLRSPTHKYWSTFLSLPNFEKDLGTIPVMRRQIEDLAQLRLSENRTVKQRFLFVVDDLDRCGDEAIVRVLEAVRLVMDIQGVVVLIAIDHRVALASLALRYQEMAKYHENRDANAIGRDYLAKLIHLPIQLQQPDSGSVEGYLVSLWGDAADDDPAPSASPNTDKPDTAKQAAAAREQQADTPDAAPAPRRLETVASKTARALDKGKEMGMSAEQKSVFIHWCHYFDIANPRQVKRLYNTYNLLRHYYVEASMAPAQVQASWESYPVLAVLFVLEYAFHHQINIDEPIDNTAIAEKLQGVKAPMGADFDEVREKIAPFVLPASGRVI